MELESLAERPELARAARTLNLGVLPVQPPEFVYRRAARDALRLSWAAVDAASGRVVGAVVAELEPDARAPTRAQVQVRTLAVDARWRRQGVGRALLARVVERAELLARSRDDGQPEVQALSLHVHAANEDAIAFYKSVGFNETARIDGYYRRLEPATAVVMQYELGVSNGEEGTTADLAK